MADYGLNFDDPDGYNYTYDDNEFVGPSPTSTNSGSWFNFDDPDAEVDVDAYFADREKERAAEDAYWSDWATKQTPQDLDEVLRMLASGSTGGLSGAGSAITGALSRAFTKPASQGGGLDWQRAAGVLGGVYGATQGGGGSKPSGYQGSIPQYSAVRETVPNAQDPNRRPGSGGQRYFSDMTYTAPDNVAAATTAAQEQATGLAALNQQNPARETRVPPAAVARSANTPPVPNRAASDVIQDLPVPRYAQGGITALAKGGSPRYLNGSTDGMADELRANIDGEQEARLSHGEFVIPADVVSHLGNGNSESGADRLYAMMNQIRKARTGNPKQGRQIDPNKFLPT